MSEGRRRRKAYDGYITEYLREKEERLVLHREELERRQQLSQDLDMRDDLRDWHVQKLERCHRELILRQGMALLS